MFSNPRWARGWRRKLLSVHTACPSSTMAARLLNALRHFVTKSSDHCTTSKWSSNYLQALCSIHSYLNCKSMETISSVPPRFHTNCSVKLHGDDIDVEVNFNDMCQWVYGEVAVCLQDHLSLRDFIRQTILLVLKLWRRINTKICKWSLLTYYTR